MPHRPHISRPRTSAAREQLKQIARDLDDATDKKTPLMQAAAKGDLQSLTYWLGQADAFLNAETKVSRHTALMFAAYHGHLACVQALAEAGAALDPVCIVGLTARGYAEKGRHAATAQWLEDYAVSAHRTAKRRRMNARADDMPRAKSVPTATPKEAALAPTITTGPTPLHNALAAASRQSKLKLKP